jgi:hypothetical protein
MGNVSETADKKGKYEAQTARHFKSSFKTLVSIVGEDEPRDARSLLEHVDAIAERWARANKSNPETMKTYKQRSRALLEDYLGYMADPASFKGRGRVISLKKSDKKDARREAPPASISEEPMPRAPFNTFRLPSGKEFRYSTPDEYTLDDLRRLVYHLLPGTIDFDPGKPGGGFPSNGLTRTE